MWRHFPLCRQHWPLIAFAVTWLSTVTWLWNRVAPVVPDRVVSFAGPAEILQARDGQLGICRVAKPSYDPDQPFLTGPLESWDLRTGRKVREVSTRNDHLFPRARTSDLKLVRSGSNFQLYCPSTAKLLDTFQCDAVIIDGMLSPNRNLAVLTTNQRTFVRDLAQHQELWSHDDWAFGKFAGDHSLIVYSQISRDQSGRIEGGSLPVGVNALTGELCTERIEGEEQPNEIYETEERRMFELDLGLYAYADAWVVLDRTSMRLQWASPMLELDSSKNEEILLMRYWKNGRLLTDRYRAADGVRLQKESPQLETQQHFEIERWQTQGHYAAFIVVPEREDPRFKKYSIRYPLLATPIDWLARLSRKENSFPHSLVVYDTPAQRQIVRFKNVEEYELLDDHHLVVVDRSGLNYYSVPPRREWKWLFGPALAPWALWIAFRGLRRWLTRCRTNRLPIAA